MYTHSNLIKAMKIIGPWPHDGAYTLISVSSGLSAHPTHFTRELLMCAMKGFCQNYAVRSGLWKHQANNGFLLSSAVAVFNKKVLRLDSAL